MILLSYVLVGLLIAITSLFLCGNVYPLLKQIENTCENMIKTVYLTLVSYCSLLKALTLGPIPFYLGEITKYCRCVNSSLAPSQGFLIYAIRRTGQGQEREKEDSLTT